MNRRRSRVALAVLVAVTMLTGFLDLLPDGVRAEAWPAPAPGDARVPHAVQGDHRNNFAFGGAHCHDLSKVRSGRCRGCWR